MSELFLCIWCLGYKKEVDENNICINCKDRLKKLEIDFGESKSEKK